MHLFFIILVFVLFISDPAWGRYFHSEADSLDSEKTLSIEHYNDIDSYELPLAWKERWQNQSTGIQTSAGSLNQTRFYFVRDLKFDALFQDAVKQYQESGAGGSYLSFHHHTVQDKLEDRSSNVLNLGYLNKLGLDFRLRGDANSYKKHSDLGAMLGFLTNSTRIYLGFWRVDHYYNSKEDQSQRRYEKKPINFDGFLAHTITLDGSAINILANWDIDRSLSLEDPSTATHYQHRRMQVHAELSLKQEDHHWKLWASRDLKKEGFANAGSAQSISLQRNYFASGLEWVYQKTWQTEINFRERRALHTAVGNFDAPPEEQILGHSVEADAYRIEPALNLRWYPEKEASGFFYGLHNHAARKVQGAKRQESLESKLLTGWQKNWKNQGFFTANATWDLDQLAVDFPYNKKEFSPWGGGSLQFQLLL